MFKKHIAACTLALSLGTLAFATVAPTFFQDMQLPEQAREHKLLQKGVGEWEGPLTMFTPGAPAAPIAATETVEAIGKFWTRSTFECDFNGMPFLGTGLMGYDPQGKAFQGTWADNMTTHLSIMEGQFDAEKNALVMSWAAPNMAGEITRHRSENVMTDNSYTITFYEEGPDKTMEITMTRKGAAATEAGSKKER